MTLTAELDLLRTAVGVVDRSDRGAVLVTGPDARSFLQALVSADLDPVDDGEGTHALLLTPRGKLDVDFRLLRVGDDVWLDTAPGFGAQLATSLNRFRIRVKAEVQDRSEGWGLVSIIGPFTPAVFPDLPAAVHAHMARGDARIVRTIWGDVPGVDVVGPADAVASLMAEMAAGIPPVSAAAFEAFRIDAGIPTQPADLDESTIPQEAFLERDAVSFTKGCFLGQELVCRIDSRGHVNRLLRSLRAIDGDWPVVGAEIVVNGAPVGMLTSVAPVELPVGALGYVRHEVEVPATVELRWDGGHAIAIVGALSALSES